MPPRNTIRLAASTGVVLVASLLVAACASDPVASSGTAESAVDGASASPQADDASLLFTLTSGGSRIKQDPEAEGGYRLLLDHVDTHAVWFTDRPERVSGIFSTGSLISGWERFGFTDVPPNAALIAHDASGNTQTAVVTVTNPLVDTQRRLMMADIAFVEEAPDFTPAPGSEIDLGKLSVFIDDAQASLSSDSSSSDPSGVYALVLDPATGTVVVKAAVDGSLLNSQPNVFGLPDNQMPEVSLVQNFSPHHGGLPGFDPTPSPTSTDAAG